MKHLVLLLPTLLLAACQSLPPEPAKAPVQAVAAVELPRYAGTWFEIARFPMFFQEHCRGDTTANYRLADDGVVTVTNRCRTDSGFDQADGKATVVEGSHNARLKVSFFWPFRSDYWVIGLDPDYHWAVVGNPNRKNLWILSRTPQFCSGPPGRLSSAAVTQSPGSVGSASRPSPSLATSTSDTMSWPGRTRPARSG